MVPLISLTFISYHISYNIARNRIIDSAVMTDRQLVSQLNDRLGQVENAADTIQFQMYSVNYSATKLPEHLNQGGIPPFFRVHPWHHYCLLFII